MTDPVLEKALRQQAVEARRPDNSAYSSLSVHAVSDLARRFDRPGRLIEIAALRADIIPERYARNTRAFTPRDQIRLLTSSVCIVGLGGLGGAVTELLARIGVGRLILVDGDVFEDSNLNRQFLSTESLLGHSKARAAAKRIACINASVETRVWPAFLTPDNAADLLQGTAAVVDCLDNIASRFVLESAARSAGTPMVSAAVAGTSGQVTTVYPQDPGLRLIYGDPDELRATKGVETALGTLPHCVTLLSALEASEVTKILLKNPSVLRNRLLLVDLTDNAFETLDLI